MDYILTEADVQLLEELGISATSEVIDDLAYTYTHTKQLVLLQEYIAVEERR